MSQWWKSNLDRVDATILSRIPQHKISPGRNSHHRRYPKIPTTGIEWDRGNNSFPIPNAAGVYFVFIPDLKGLSYSPCLYVGSSGNLKSRLTNSHGILGPIIGMQRQGLLQCKIAVSWLCMEEGYGYAECYYIGILEPLCNFGNSDYLSVLDDVSKVFDSVSKYEEELVNGF